MGHQGQNRDNEGAKITCREKIGTLWTKHVQQVQNRDKRYKTGTSGDKTGKFMGKVRKPIVLNYL